MYRWVEHTAELELAIEGASEEEVFAEAVAAFAELLGDEAADGQSREIQLSADDRAAQLVELLEEIVFLADASGFIPESLDELDLSGKRARVSGHEGVPRPLVKAVTYHGLVFRPTPAGWEARLVLDV
jgi:SHS2 domain-containing protein